MSIDNAFYITPYNSPEVGSDLNIEDCIRCAWDQEKNSINTSKAVIDGKFCYVYLPLIVSKINNGNVSYNRIESATIQYRRSTDQTYSTAINMSLSNDHETATGLFTLIGTTTEDEIQYNLTSIDSSYTKTQYDAVVASATDGFLSNESYWFKITVTDTVGRSGEKEIFLNSIPYTMHLREGGEGVAFGTISSPNRGKAVEIASDWKLYLGDTVVDAN